MTSDPVLREGPIDRSASVESTGTIALKQPVHLEKTVQGIMGFRLFLRWRMYWNDGKR